MSIVLLLKKVYRKFRAVATFDATIPEITPMNSRFQDELGDEPRLNILVPTLNPAHVFGGITTAIHFYENLADELGIKRRMIVTDEETIPEYLGKYKGYKMVNCSDNAIFDRQVVPFSNRVGKTIPVGKNDIFVCTGWWTAYNAREILKNIEQNAGVAKPLVYLVQDYEPYFYPWSSRSALAESTYRMDKPVIAVFNSSELKDYFKLHNYSFYKEYCFDPALNASLKKELINNPPVKKEKKIIVYGRPSVQRNCFEIVADSLRKWSVMADDASEWQLISAGEKHADLTIGNGCVLRSCGKLSIEEYAKMMGSCYAGISLMVSPHPSYPPLEMSTFGIKTITNTYENKDMASFNDNIVSLSNMTPENIANKLLEITNSFDESNFNLATDTDYFNKELSLDSICKGIKENLEL
ncbi:MAG: hypothetical protein IKU82_06720 [Clostridia bacterium]|nr:hypothetical protein [Clostridia bacterium]